MNNLQLEVFFCVEPILSSSVQHRIMQFVQHIFEECRPTPTSEFIIKTLLLDMLKVRTFDLSVQISLRFMTQINIKMFCVVQHQPNVSPLNSVRYSQSCFEICFL